MHGCGEIDNICIPGDINFDGSIDIFDIVIMIQIILMEHYNIILDMNSDNTIDIIDIIDILNIIL